MAEQKTVELIYDIASDVRKKLNVTSRDIDDDVVINEIQATVLSDPRTRHLTLDEKKAVMEGAFNSLRRELDFLEKYLEDPGISEIMVNGRNDIFVEKNGVMYRVPEYFPTDRALEEVIMRIGAGIHREINEMNPILDARLEDGSRVHAVYKNVAINGPVLNIRRFPNNRITMEELIHMGSITEEAADFLKRLVECGYNIFLSGGTSSGKTTFLNALSDFIPPDERVIVIEDSAELQLDGIENIVRMETKNANIQGVGEITMRHLIKASLRMRPDRIIVGEVRGGEVVDMINSMNTGHDGSLSTGHANSAEGMLSRLETMFLTAAAFPIDAVRSQIASAIDIIVHMGRLSDKSRKILEITEVMSYRDGRINLNPLFEYQLIEDEDGVKRGRLVRTENSLVNTGKLELKGGM
ncbi:MAG: CpaF family protein [Anaerovoracaceae bacterium]|nr:CpaF family protein [Bacillota bacterium]MDY2670294.1 CpaF family protein [Anaerovoracaceae bacterium]